MVKLPNLKTLEVKESNDPLHNEYVAEFDDEFMSGTVTIKAKKTNDYYGTEHDTIKESSDKFVNGFKVVRLDNGKYSYVRESDNQLVPFKYDFACDFNEYGMAMVAKGGYVTWINTDFEVSISGLLNMYEDKSDINFVGWHKITEFSNGKTPLSIMEFRNVKRYGKYVLDKSYALAFRTSGKALKFFNAEKPGESKYQFTSIDPFNNNEQTVAYDGNGDTRDCYVIQSDGLYISAEKFIELISQRDSQSNQDNGYAYQKAA